MGAIHADQHDPAGPGPCCPVYGAGYGGGTRPGVSSAPGRIQKELRYLLPPPFLRP